jgi:hypothetical protein
VLPVCAILERNAPVASVLEADPAIAIAMAAVVERDTLIAAVLHSEFTIAVAAIFSTLGISVPMTALILD